MTNQLIVGDCRKVLASLADESVDCCVTSPPYFGLRDYGTAIWKGGDASCDHVADPSKTKKFGNPAFNENRPSREQTKVEGYYYKDVCGKCGAVRTDAQIGLEQTPDAYVQELVGVFREVRRVLRNDGTLWLNLGDSYAAARSGTHQPAETLAGGRGGKTANGEKVNRDRFDGYNPTRNASAIGLKHKDLIGIPWRVAFALQADGWYLRQDIIWHKPNPMPESVTDRCTKAHEYIFLLSKSAKYFYNHQAIMEPAEYGEQHANKATSWGKNRKHPNKANVADYAFKGDNHTTSRMADGSFGRNRRSVWTVTTKPCKEAHFATYPTDLIVPCILAGSKPDGVVLDPFNGAGTTGLVALSNGRRYVGIELNTEYAEISMRRFGLMATLVNLRNHEECQREVEI